MDAPHLPTANSVPPDSMWAAAVRSALRVIPSLGIKPERFFNRTPLSGANASVRDPGGRMKIEVVSHCWNYSHLLVYQLSSLVLSPPQTVEIVMTVCYCSEDKGTAELLAFFEQQNVPGVTWNWIEVPREVLLRRSVGRNLAAKASEADWVWFTDCDVVFADGCFDGLAEAVADCRDLLVYPREERCTMMLDADDPVLVASREGPGVRSVNFDDFLVQRPRQATGPLQITRGDAARTWGYCGEISSYQRTTDRWRKTYEDRVFRWLLGTRGTPVEFPGVYRIKHVEKGRYQSGWWGRLRSFIRRRDDASRGDAVEESHFRKNNS
ncbi:MAG: hypothetical protein SynsKO_12650 [Synoicihabitans sp.]